jgi:hypothetical protein
MRRPVVAEATKFFLGSGHLLSICTVGTSTRSAPMYLATTSWVSAVDLNLYGVGGARSRTVVLYGTDLETLRVGWWGKHEWPLQRNWTFSSRTAASSDLGVPPVMQRRRHSKARRRRLAARTTRGAPLVVGSGGRRRGMVVQGLGGGFSYPVNY